VTLDVYAGLFGDDLDAVAERLDAAAELSRTKRGPTSSRCRRNALEKARDLR
jgi:hypothetical protein